MSPEMPSPSVATSTTGTHVTLLKVLSVAAILIFMAAVGFVLMRTAAFSGATGQSFTTTLECETAYGSAVGGVAENYIASGWDAQSAVYLSDTLGLCVGIVIAESGTQTEVLVFDAKTGDTLDPTDTAIAIEEYSSL